MEKKLCAKGNNYAAPDCYTSSCHSIAFSIESPSLNSMQQSLEIKITVYCSRYCSFSPVIVPPRAFIDLHSNKDEYLSLFLILVKLEY